MSEEETIEQLAQALHDQNSPNHRDPGDKCLHWLDANGAITELRKLGWLPPGEVPQYEDADSDVDTIAAILRAFGTGRATVSKSQEARAVMTGLRQHGWRSSDELQHVGYEDPSNGRLRTKYEIDVSERARCEEEDDLDVYNTWHRGQDPLFRLTPKEQDQTKAESK